MGFYNVNDELKNKRLAPVVEFPKHNKCLKPKTLINHPLNTH